MNSDDVSNKSEAPEDSPELDEVIRQIERLSEIDDSSVAEDPEDSDAGETEDDREGVL